MNCKPKMFFRKEGVIGLTWWIDKTEYVVEISLYTEDSKVKFTACTFVDATLSLWNGHSKTLGIVNANSLSWGELNKIMIEEYFPQEEIHKLEQELWSLTMNVADIISYPNQF